MWLFCGLITLTAAFFYFLHRQTQAGWKGTTARRDGNAYLVQYVEEKGGWKTLRVGVEAPLDFAFKIRNEKPSDRWLQGFGLNAELAVTDASLDQALYFESNDVVLARVLAERQDVRLAIAQAIRAIRLHQAQLVALRAASGRLWFEVRFKQAHWRPRIESALAPLVETIAKGLREAPLRRPLDARDPFVRRAAILLACSTSVFVLAIVGLQWYAFGAEPLLDPWAVWVASLVPAALIQAGLAMVAVRWLKRSARAHLVLLEIMTIGAIGVFGSTFLLLREANMALDFHRPVVRAYSEATVYTQRSRRGRVTYYLSVEKPILGGDETMQVRISHDVNHGLPTRPGGNPFLGRPVGAVRVYVFPGLFGFPWVKRIEPLPSSTP